MKALPPVKKIQYFHGLSILELLYWIKYNIIVLSNLYFYFGKHYCIQKKISKINSGGE